MVDDAIRPAPGTPCCDTLRPLSARQTADPVSLPPAPRARTALGVTLTLREILDALGRRGAVRLSHPAGPLGPYST
jgi:hypothetical protein